MDTTKSSAPARPAETRPAELEERCRHELMDAEERLELEETIRRLKKEATIEAGRSWWPPRGRREGAVPSVPTSTPPCVRSPT